MELRQLRAFVEVAELGHFGHAAKRLNLTQPALTQRIQLLERELKVQLLQRNSRKVSLTDGGILFLPRARALLDAEEEALREMRNYSRGFSGRLRIAYQTAGDISLAGSIIAEFRRRFPSVEMETSSGSSGPNLQRLRERSIDAAFVMLPVERPAEIAAQAVRREEVILALRSDHKLARYDRIPVAALRGAALGMPPAAVNPPVVAALRRWLESRTGAELNVVSEDPTDLAIETLVRSGLAFTMVIGRYINVPSGNGIAYRSMSPAPFVDLAIAYHTDDSTPPLANLLRVAGEIAPFDPDAVPEDGELL